MFKQPLSGLRTLPRRWRAGPDADLAHLPVSLDLRAVSLAEGIRAALSVAAIVAANEVLAIPALGEVGVGALLTCLVDPGGPIRRRIPVLAGFALLGTIAAATFTLIRNAGPIPAALAETLFIFAAMLARAWGPGAMQVGNLLTVVSVLACDRGAPLPDAARLGALFGAGALWALLLTLVIWRLHPFRPARAAVAEIYRRIGQLGADLSEQLAAATHPDWTAHARAHRRWVRDAIEAARIEVLEAVRARGPGGPRANNLLIQLEAAEQIFGAVIALSDVLEHDRADPAAARESCSQTALEDTAPAARDRVRPTLPALRLLLAAIADAILADQPQDDAHRELYAHLLAEIERGMAGETVGPVVAALLQRLRIAALMVTPEGETAAGLGPGEQPPLATRLLAPLQDALTWRSAALRHAVRAAAIALPALLVTLHEGTVLAHWLTITLVLTLQPFFALTWQRALERVGGTVLGGVAAALLATVVHGPLATVALLFPVTVFAFAVRRVSFGLFMAGLTPLVVLLVDLGEPGTGELTIAAWRAAYTVAGGGLAVLAGLLLWPSWEPARVRGDLLAAIAAHAVYADRVLASFLSQADPGGLDAARRRAGVASNALETTLSRALQEPARTTREELGAAMLADAALRRVAGRLSVLQHAGPPAPDPTLREWRAWLAAAFAAIPEGRPLPAAPPDPDGGLARIARQLTLVHGALSPDPSASSAPAATPPPVPAPPPPPSR